MQNQTTDAPTIPSLHAGSLTRRSALSVAAGLGLVAVAVADMPPVSAEAATSSGSSIIVSPTNEQYSLIGLVEWLLSDSYTGTLSDGQVADLERALELYEAYEDCFDLDDDDDAADLDHVLASLDQIDTLSGLITTDENFTGYDAYHTNLTMLVGSAYTANVSIDEVAHVSKYSSFAYSEGLAWGSSNPSSGWYTLEKAYFDAYRDSLGYTADDVEYGNAAYYAIVSAASAAGYTTGHYTTLFYCGTTQLMGVGYTTEVGEAGYSKTWSYNPSTTTASKSGGYCYTTDEMRALVDEYLSIMAMPIWRLYNPYSGEHHFTADENEYATLASLGWTQEGVAWYAPASGTSVWRLYNPYSGDHHYTTDANEYATLAALGWEQEGVAFRSADASAKGAVAVWRLYNPYATSFYHHYTLDPNERSVLVGLGWDDEGVGWYAFG